MIQRHLSGARSLLIALAAISAACEGGTDDDPIGGNEPPEVAIVSPEDGGRVLAALQVTLEGTATDPEDGELDGASVTWSSDLDGTLGEGLRLNTTLSEGLHTLTLTATDSEGATDEDSVQVEVSSENLAPVPVVIAPEDDAIFREGDIIALSGEALDPEDGGLSGSALVWTSSIDGVLGQGAEVEWLAPSLGEHQLIFSAIDRQGLQASTSISVLVAGIGEDVPPQVTLLQPLDGAVLTAGETVELLGEATDLEDGDLSGSSLAWSSSLDGALGTGESLSVELASGAHALSLTATDSVGQSRTETINVSVVADGLNPPTVTLLQPTTGSVFYDGDDVTLQASATDPEDGTLTGSGLSWSSDLDGSLGTGTSLTVSTLSVGSHSLTVTAEDSDGAQAAASVAVSVLPVNDPPVVTIQGPASGGTYVAGTSITFDVDATDPEDGALTGSSIVWQSSLDGQMGTGESLSYASLTAGSHLITATALDSGGRSGSDSISLTVDPAPVNLAPVASWIVPAEGFVDLDFTVDASGSTDPDGTIASYEVDFGDGSSVVSSTDPSITHTYTAEGIYSLTLTVTDDDGATATASGTTTVVIPPRVPVVAADHDGALGGWCALSVDGNDDVHVLYRDAEHEQVWYTTNTSGSWSSELVAGPGFLVGGYASPHGGDMVLDASDEPHAVFMLDGVVYYAPRSSGTWPLTVANPTEDARSASQLAIALDPSQSDRVTVGFESYDASTGSYPAVSTLSAGSFTEEVYDTIGSAWIYRFRGGMAFDASGTLYMSAHDDQIGAVEWTASAGFDSYTLAGTSPYNVGGEKAPVVMDDNDEPLIAHRGGVVSRSGTTWTSSVVANSGLYDVAVAWDPIVGEPVVAFQNDQGQLEILRTTDRQYWWYTYQGPMSGGDIIDAAVNSLGEEHVCFFRDGNLLVF